MSRIRSLNISRNYRQKKDRRLEKEEIVEKRMELVRIKGVFWKHRGERRSFEKKKVESTNLREKMEEIVEAKERIRREDELEKERRKKSEEKWKQNKSWKK